MYVFVCACSKGVDVMMLPKLAAETDAITRREKAGFIAYLYIHAVYTLLQPLGEWSWLDLYFTYCFVRIYINVYRR